MVDVNPVAQTFFVDSALYPNGLMISSLDLFFSRKDESGIPVKVYISEVIEDVPSEQAIPNSTVVLNPSAVNTSVTADTATTFVFPDLVFLSSDKEYAIVVFTNSLDYTFYVAEVGGIDIISNNNISTQPLTGKFYRSQAGNVWEPEETLDLKFKLKRASFTTNTNYTLQMDTKPVSNTSTFSNTEVNEIKAVMGETIPDGTSISYTLDSLVETSLTKTGYIDIASNKNQSLSSTRLIRTDQTGDFSVRATLRTTDEKVSPSIKKDRTTVYSVENLINNTTDLTLSETDPSGPGGYNGGDARAKYITRRITLQDGFESTGLKVLVDVNKPFGTSIEVYYKVLSSEDSEDFDKKSYVKMSKDNEEIVLNNTQRDEDFVEEQYTAENITYISNNTTYDTYKTFAVKIVMYSNDKTVVPKLKNFRAIATL